MRTEDEELKARALAFLNTANRTPIATPTHTHTHSALYMCSEQQVLDCVRQKGVRWMPDAGDIYVKPNWANRIGEFFF